MFANDTGFCFSTFSFFFFLTIQIYLFYLEDRAVAEEARGERESSLSAGAG